MSSRLLDEILDFAIRSEERAAALYHYLADTAGPQHMKAVFLCFATEEEMHKQRLLEIKAGTRSLACGPGIASLRPVEDAPEVTLDLAGQMDYSEALAFAIRNEQAAHELYTKLAETISDAACKATLSGLAHEEAQHQARFQTEYEEYLRRR